MTTRQIAPRATSNIAGPFAGTTIPASEISSRSPLGALQRRVTDNLSQLLEVLPPSVRQHLGDEKELEDLLEIVMDLGRVAEARFADRVVELGEIPVTADDLEFVVGRVGSFGKDNRAGIERTLHRISAIRNRQGRIIGLTCRIGRAVYGTIDIIQDVVESGKSILLLGRPGRGKTTKLREVARILSDELKRRVVIVDTSNEIAGDGDIPHPGIGRARRMQVATPEQQHSVMIEAVENHMPEVIVIDEIGTEQECFAARTIAERGVQLVGTAHGNSLENLMMNPTLSDLVGGIHAVTLSDDEAKRRGTQKTVLERKAPPTFDVVIEIMEVDKLALHLDVERTVDKLLRGTAPRPEIRVRNEQGEIEIIQKADGSRGIRELPDRADDSGRSVRGDRMDRTVTRPPRDARPRYADDRTGYGPDANGFDTNRPDANRPDANRPDANRLDENGVDAGGRGGSEAGGPHGNGAYGNGATGNEATGNDADPEPLSGTRSSGTGGPNTARTPSKSRPSTVRIFPYGVSRSRLDRAVTESRVPAYIARDVADADVVLALKATYVRDPGKMREAAQRRLPIYVVRSNTYAQIAGAVRDVFGLKSAPEPEDNSVENVLQQTQDAIDRVRRTGMGVELPPASSYTRRLQHQLIERYQLTSESVGVDPQRRVRILPVGE